MPTTQQPDFQLGVGDDQVAMDFTITDAFGAYVDITGATVVAQIQPLNQSTGPVNKAGSVVGATPFTKARYLWRAADTGAAGLFTVVFLVTLLSGERITWPTARPPLLIQIGPASAA